MTYKRHQKKRLCRFLFLEEFEELVKESFLDNAHFRCTFDMYIPDNYGNQVIKHLLFTRSILLWNNIKFKRSLSSDSECKLAKK